MISINNVDILNKYFKQTWNSFKEIQNNLNNDLVEVEESKDGYSTLNIINDNKKVYIHSKYRPIKEANTIIDSYNDIKEYEHVIFYGVGLGYHIKEFISRYPDKEISIYEPIPEIFEKFISNNELSNFNIKNLNNIFFERNNLDAVVFLNNFTSAIKGKVLLITLPIYERIFKDKVNFFYETLQKLISEKRFSLNTNAAYEKLWILNSMINFPKVLESPNILNEKKKFFSNKPVIIVSAGPSLEYEIENLRYIKENKLAYIFSVGSSINTLIENNIYPDAMCTYDPTHLNKVVFEKVYDREIDDIPMIFGSSVGFETIQKYKGPTLHMITSQDTISQYYLKNNDNSELIKVNDAPSIAIITIELLMRLGVNPIILVGQNLAFKDDKIYSKGIDYKHITEEKIKEVLKDKTEVEDVYGNIVYTNDAFNRMRNNIELYIKNNPGIEVINTTKYGAKIEGADFVELEDVIKNRLKEAVVDEDWYLVDKTEYDLEYLEVQRKKMIKEFEELLSIRNKIIKIFKEMDKLIKIRNAKDMEKVFTKFDKEFKKFNNNEYFQYFLKPMNRVNYDFLMRKISSIRSISNKIKKAQIVLEEFGKVIYLCNNDIKTTQQIFELNNNVINKYIQDNKNTL